MLAIFRDPCAVRPREDEQAIVGNSQTEPTLVHETMMEPAERDEVAELRLLREHDFLVPDARERIKMVQKWVLVK